MKNNWAADKAGAGGGDGGGGGDNGNPEHSEGGLVFLKADVMGEEEEEEGLPGKAFGLFGPNSAFRRSVAAVVDTQLFDNLVLFFIGVFC